jgi:5-methylcytosine-specific restriction endonuclease McrA
MKWHCDHKVALVNEGENRESNLQVLCALCHLHKTAEDVAEKSRVVRKRLKHLGIRKAKGRPLPGTKASGLRKRINGRVEKR